MFRNTLAAVLAVASFAAQAAGGYSGTLASVYPMGDGYILIYPTNAITGTRPGCATTADRFVVDTTTQGGKNQFHALMIAVNLGKSVTIWGTNACPSTYNSEGLYYLSVTE